LRAQPGYAYAFAGAELRAVARNIFLDGNSFRDSANVHKETLVSDIQAGYAVLWNPFKLYLTYTLRSREFRAQNRNDQFLAFSFSFAG